ncbi:Guanyl-specific ribonuclease F1-like protein [Elsinoe fawcettii]|nr:Guanyl-specific ribonuclease F1-like protein [Elsinoe fawcettii]
MQLTTLFSSAILFASALAGPIPAADAAPALDKRQTTCGSKYYDANDAKLALNAGCQRFNAGTTVSGYPHRYNNYEGFEFDVPGPWQEFPIIDNKAYTGGSPGADRIIFNEYCEVAGFITHTGASGNNFVGCSGTST